MSGLTYHNIKDIRNIKLHGRMDTGLDVVPLLSNGHGIEVNVSGSQLWADVEADYTDFEPWAAIEINGELISRFMIDKGSHRICLFRGIDSSRVTRIKFYRELQAMSDDKTTNIIIKGLETDGEFMAPPSYDYRLEFIGDSINSGEGSYGAVTDEDWTAYCMSYSRTYVNLVGRMLNAECRVMSQGGWGVFSGWDNDRRNYIPRYYDRICGLASGGANDKYGAGRSYDFSSWIPDAILINLGTNDCSGFSQPPFTDPETGAVYKLNTNEDGTFASGDVKLITDAAVAFLKTVRKNNPTSHIVWLYGMLGYKLSLPLSEAVNRYITETGDKNVTYIQLPMVNETTVGARLHPGLKCHKLAAEIITDYLKEHFSNQPLS
ncbi:MAG: GDSL family lipase [Lachnospiraceae bacterium]|nr:GDSL family lipase [Lachnospiraceae bacterium]